MFLPTDIACSAHRIPSVTEFVWPLAAKSVLRGHGGAPAAVCYNDGSICWIADTDRGYHLVPESDINRGVSDIVPNPGAVRLSTANGEVDAAEYVKFSLPEIQLRKQMGTTTCSERGCTLYR